MLDIVYKCIDIEDGILNCIVRYPIIINQQNDVLINEINNKIYGDIVTFREVSKQQLCNFNDKHNIYIEFTIALNKNDLISFIGYFSNIDKDNYTLSYINVYNYDLTNKKSIKLRDVFEKNFNYKEFINKYIRKKINRKFRGITENQSFYITEQYISINFSSYEIIDSSEIKEFKLYFEDITEHISEYTKKYIMEGYNERVQRI